MPSSNTSWCSNPYEGIPPLTSGPPLIVPSTSQTSTVHPFATQRCKIVPGSKASDYRWLPDPTTKVFIPTKPNAIPEPAVNRRLLPQPSIRGGPSGGPSYSFQPEQQAHRESVVDSFRTRGSSTFDYPVDADNNQVPISQAPQMRYRSLPEGSWRQGHQSLKEDAMAPRLTASGSSRISDSVMKHFDSQRVPFVTSSDYLFGFGHRNPPPGLSRGLLPSFQQESHNLDRDYRENIGTEQWAGPPIAPSSKSQQSLPEKSIETRTPSVWDVRAIPKSFEGREASSSSKPQVLSSIEPSSLSYLRFQGSFSEILTLGLSSCQSKEFKLGKIKKWIRVVKDSGLEMLDDNFIVDAATAYSTVGYIPQDSRPPPPTELSSVALLVHLPLLPNGQIQTSLTRKLDLRDFISSAYNHHLPIHYHITADPEYNIDESATYKLIDATKTMIPILEPSQFAATLTYTSVCGNKSKLSDACLSLITEMKRSGTKIVVVVGVFQDVCSLECYMNVCSGIEGISLVVIEDLVTDPRSTERETLERKTLWQAEFISSRLWNVQDLWSPHCYVAWRKSQYDPEWKNNLQPGLRPVGYRRRVRRVDSASTVTVSSRGKSIFSK